MRDKILALLREKGPMFPAEVAAKLGGNSFLMKVYLSELVSEKHLLASSFGLKEGKIYFLPGQEKAAEKKVNQILSIKRTPLMYSDSKNKKLSSETLEKQRKFAQLAAEAEKKDAEFERIKAQRMKELETQRKQEAARQEKFLKEQARKQTLEKQRQRNFQSKAPIIHKPNIQQTQQTSAYFKQKQEIKKAKSSNFIDNAMNFLQEHHIEITEELESKKKEIDLLLNVPSPLGPLPFFCRIRDKKKINDADLSLVHSQALQKNMNALLLTPGSLSKSAQEFLEKTKNMFVKII